ncbi:hypothetical protein ACI65C_007192, partial [Semiaphis heraclei]
MGHRASKTDDEAVWNSKLQWVRYEQYPVFKFNNLDLRVKRPHSAYKSNQCTAFRDHFAVSTPSRRSVALFSADITTRHDGRTMAGIVPDDFCNVLCYRPRNIDANTEMYEQAQSIVYHTGDVLWVPPVQYRVYCKADMTHWPYDTQTGVLKIGSWVYSTNMINMTDTAHEIEIISPQSEWQISEISSEKISKFYSCCPDEPYNHVEYNITINRGFKNYHPVMIVPALCTALLNLLVFWHSLDDCKNKLMICLFNALIVIVILQVLYSKIPLLLSTVPLIALYYTYSLGLIVLTAIISVVIKNMTVTRKPLSKPISSIVQSKFIEYLAMEVNEPSSSKQTQNEDKEIDLQYIEFNKRQTFAKIIDKICFIIFSIIY